jgi:hypothetical protein
MDYKFIKAVYPFGQPLDAATEFAGTDAQCQICTTPLYFQYVPLTPHQFKTPPRCPDPLRLTGPSVVPNIDPLVENYDFDVLAIFGMATPIDPYRPSKYDQRRHAKIKRVAALVRTRMSPPSKSATSMLL